MQVWNPGEFVYDQTTGEPYIDDDGQTHLVAPRSQLTASDGRRMEADDVAVAAWYHANLYEGEALGDETVGVPFLRLALGTGDIGQAVTVVAAEVSTRTPGVAGLVDLRDVRLDGTRVLTFGATLLRAGGGEQDFTTIVG